MSVTGWILMLLGVVLLFVGLDARDLHDDLGSHLTKIVVAENPWLIGFSGQ